MAVQKQNMIDVQTLGAYLDLKLVDAIKLSKVVAIDNTLVGKAGSKLELPAYSLI